MHTILQYLLRFILRHNVSSLKVAKDETGRDSLAITIWKRAGRVITWSAPWEVVLKKEPNIFSYFIKRFGKDKENYNNEERQEFTTSFIYNLQSRIIPFKLDEDSSMTIEEKVSLFTDLITAEIILRAGHVKLIRKKHVS